MRTILKSVLNLLSYKTHRKLLLILSDDWGSVRIKSKEDQLCLVSNGLNLSNRFDRFDSLETNEDLELLFEVLTKHKDYLGNYPVVTAVTNTGNPDFDRIKSSNFEKYFYETIDQTFNRYDDSNNVMSLIREGIHQKIFVPQSHGREHVQVNWWMNELQDKNSHARKLFKNQFFFLGDRLVKNPKRGRGLGAAFDVWEQKDIESHIEIIKTGLYDFEKLFGYQSSMFTPPAMFYNPKIETVLFSLGISWLDVGRFFKIPKVGGGESFQFNYLGKKKNSGLKVLVRNCMFEPNISNVDNGVERALFDIEQSFKYSQPAILSNHRAAFVGRIDKGNRGKGLNALNELLKKILKKWPDVEFVSVNSL